MGFLPKVTNYKFGSLPPVEILAEAEIAIDRFPPPELGATLISPNPCCKAAAYDFYVLFELLNAVQFWNGFGKFRGTSIWTMKIRRFSAAEMADFVAILPRPD